MDFTPQTASSLVADADAASRRLMFWMISWDDFRDRHFEKDVEVGAERGLDLVRFCLEALGTPDAETVIETRF